MQSTAAHYQQQQEDATAAAVANAPQSTQPVCNSTTDGSAGAQDVAVNTENNSEAAAGRHAVQVLRALCQYAPMDLADGPASLSKVCEQQS